jgi:N4-gp56 family major capsid protein
MTAIYGATDGSTSSIGEQFRTDYYYAKSLKEMQKEKYFTQLADTKNQPKNMGKTMKMYNIIPLLDERNTNDQGIDAAGVILTSTKWYIFENGAAVINTSGYSTEALALAAVTDSDTQTVTQGYGNLYGGSKDIGTVQGKLPALSENGGTVNGVGFTRLPIEGSLEKFGFFQSYTKESEDFDTDPNLVADKTREMIFGAHELTEAMLQIDLINHAGVEFFPGAATVDTIEELTGETGTDVATVIAYDDLVKMDIELTNNRCPKKTKIITGHRNTDTMVVPAARIMYIGSEMLPTMLRMKDYHDEKAFIPVAHYAAAGSPINGEVGTIAGFRVVVVPEMFHHAGAGASVTSNAGYRETNDKYDAYPMVVVGDESFSTIGFQSNGKTVKFKIKHCKPESPESYAMDKYGETGFMSIKFYYGFLPERTERLAVAWSVAEI